MKVRIGLVGVTHRGDIPDWPLGWPVPHVNDTVHITQHGMLYVRSVTWYLHENGLGDDHVYVVLGTTRKTESF